MSPDASPAPVRRTFSGLRSPKQKPTSWIASSLHFRGRLSMWGLCHVVLTGAGAPRSDNRTEDKDGSMRVEGPLSYYGRVEVTVSSVFKHQIPGNPPLGKGSAIAHTGAARIRSPSKA